MVKSLNEGAEQIRRLLNKTFKGLFAGMWNEIVDYRADTVTEFFAVETMCSKLFRKKIKKSISSQNLLESSKIEVIN